VTTFATSNRLVVAADVGIIGIITYLIGALANAWVTFGVPYGSDAFSQLQITKWILDFWPHVTWSYQWNAGMPLMQWYPPGFCYIVAALVILTHSSIEVATVSFLFILYFIGAVGLYAFVLRLGSSRQLALVAAVLALISPSVWDQFVVGGTYGRAAALMMLPLALWLVLESTRTPQVGTVANKEVFFGKGEHKRENWMRVTYSALLITLSLAILFDPALGVLVLAITLLAILFFGGTMVGIPKVVKVIISVMLIDASFLFPFLIEPPLGAAPSETGGPINYFALSRFPARESTYLSLSPIVVVFAIVVLVVSRRVRNVPSTDLLRRGYGFLFVLILLILFSMLLSLLLPPIVGYVGPLVAILPFLLAPFAAVHYGRALTQIRKYARYITPLLIVAMLGSLILISGVPVGRVFLNSTNADSSSELFRQLVVDQGQTQYRIGIQQTDGWIGEWWNYRSQVPQTRDYFAQGELHPEWYAQLNDGVWNHNNYEETNFLLDWWAVKWILVNSLSSDPSKFLAKPSLYRSVANISNPPIYEFEYDNSLPILYATNAPSLLVIAGDQYGAVINDLSYSGFSDSHVIPIHGGSYIDDYSLEYLEKFDAILLYGYSFHNNATAFNLLSQYVNDGGGLIVDTGFSPDSNATSLPTPFPVESTHWTHLGTAWDFSWIGNALTKDVDFTSFSPAIWASSLPWSISAAYNSSVRNWATTVAWDGGLPLMVAGQLGKGRVFWTGMNLLYHLRSYKNYEEAKLFANLVSWACGTAPQVPNALGYAAMQENPEQDTVVLNGAVHGILLKQFWFKDWTATLSLPNGTTQALQIYMVGPDFMYVTLPKGVSFPATVTFTFDKTIGYAGLAISLAAIVCLTAYAVFGARALGLDVLARRWRRMQERLRENWLRQE
jgi:hypothetical protein